MQNLTPIEFTSYMEREISTFAKKKSVKLFQEYGIVVSVQDGVAVVTGLRKVGSSETVKFSKGISGMVQTLERDVTRICLMGSDSAVKPGDIVFRLRKFVEVPAGLDLLGRVVNSLGMPIDGKGPLIRWNSIKMKNKSKMLNSFKLATKKAKKANKIAAAKIKKANITSSSVKTATITSPIVNTASSINTSTTPTPAPRKRGRPAKRQYSTMPEKIKKAKKGVKAKKSGKVTNQLKNKLVYYRVERPAPGIMARQSIHEPLQTGLKAIDAMIPIGRGQRELILGDRGTGKTMIAIDAIINQTEHTQRHPYDKIVCVYVAIGQRQSKVQEVVNILEKHNALSNTCIVFAPAYAPVILQFIAPYAGTSIGEYFRDSGKHSLVVYDDLTKHAQLHRQLSLLLKTPPGREAYPGDVFYVHARLLERAAKLSKARRSGSLTSLPIVETFDGDSTAYIPTNIISITDGQIYLRQDLFFSGIRPAINLNFSVSRVGSAAQIESMRLLCGKLKLQMALYNDYKIFARFSTDLDPTIKQLLSRGDRLLELFKQRANVPLSVQRQILSFYIGLKGFLDNVPLSNISAFEHQLHMYAQEHAIWYPFFLNLSDDIDEAVTNTLISTFMTSDYLMS